MFFDKRNQNFIAFMTSFELLRIITFFQKTINFVEQFVRIANHILNAYISEKCQTFVNDVVVKRNRNDHENKKVVSQIRIFMLRHIQNLNKVLIDIERSRTTISDRVIVEKGNGKTISFLPTCGKGNEKISLPACEKERKELKLFFSLSFSHISHTIFRIKKDSLTFINLTYISQ